MSEQKHIEPKGAKSIKSLVKKARAKAESNKDTMLKPEQTKPARKKRKRLQ